MTDLPPEPPIGGLVVECDDSWVYKRYADGWYAIGADDDPGPHTWEFLLSESILTVLREGPALRDP